MEFLYTDKELLQLIAEESEQSFRQLYDRYAGKIYAMAMSYLKSPTTAQDAVQEVFVKIWEKRYDLTMLESFPAYLHVITRNFLINQLQKKIPIFSLDELALQVLPEDRHLPHQQLDYRELTSLISRAVDQLPPRQKQIYCLSRQKGLSHQQIAKQLNLSYDTVREHMSKALKNVRTCLEEKYGHFGLLLWWFLHS